MYLRIASACTLVRKYFDIGLYVLRKFYCLPLTEIWRSNFWRESIHGSDSWPVKPQLKPSWHSNLSTLFWAVLSKPEYSSAFP